ncbi:hypothetical protein PG988_009255 [Apiospora saccharicola]
MSMDRHTGDKTLVTDADGLEEFLQRRRPVGKPDDVISVEDAGCLRMDAFVCTEYRDTKGLIQNGG